jgi:hypothetical protein
MCITLSCNWEEFYVWLVLILYLVWLACPTLFIVVIDPYYYTNNVLEGLISILGDTLVKVVEVPMAGRNPWCCRESVDIHFF